MAYMTSEVGFIRCDRKDLVDSFLEWQSTIFSPLGWRLRSSNGVGLANGLSELAVRVKSPITRHLFVSAGDGWVAYFDNGPHGTDAAAVLPQLSLRTKAVSVRFVCSEKVFKEEWPFFLKEKSRYPARIFEYFNASDDASRVVFSANDGGKWKHAQYGSTLNREDELIGPVDKENPFTSEKLEELLSSLGIYAFDESWYGDVWTLVSKEK